jgi:phosphoadenosine phosphosulfate reductase
VEENIIKYKTIVNNMTASEIINWALKEFRIDRIALASSLNAEDQVLTDIIVKADKSARIFTIDTGRLHQETYDAIYATMQKYDIHYEILFPENTAIENMVSEYGPNLFYESLKNRKMCCSLRKLEPLKRILSKLDAWICGLRTEQSVKRKGVSKIEWDENNNLFKINPLAEWSEKDIWNYIHENNVPYNRMNDFRYPSIGCAPCTRAVKKGEDFRAGRWWWEEAESKECGLHFKNGKLVRVKE